MKAIFCGTPEIAVPSLNALAEIAEVVGVICQPDRPSGRGMKLRAPAVKIRAQELGFEVFQPEKVKDGQLSNWIKQKQADVALVIAYGRILNLETLSAPRLGCLNLHASILPKYRGAAPIQRAIMAGEHETGVCLMKMDEGMDTGDVLACHRLAISAKDDTGTLSEKIGHLAALVTRTELPRYISHELISEKQLETGVSYAAPIGKDDSRLDFSRSAEEISSQIRGLSPRPGAWTLIERESEKKRRLKILEARVENSEVTQSLAAGELVAMNDKLFVGTGRGGLQVLRAQLEGKKVQPVFELLRGRGLQATDKLVAE